MRGDEIEKAYKEQVIKIREQEKKQEGMAKWIEQSAQIATSPFQKALKSHEDKLQERVKELEAQIKSRENLVYTRLVGTIAVLPVPSFMCAECHMQYQVTVMDDRLRYRFRHDKNEKCSNTLTEFFRPTASFTQFI